MDQAVDPNIIQNDLFTKDKFSPINKVISDDQIQNSLFYNEIIDTELEHANLKHHYGISYKDVVQIYQGRQVKRIEKFIQSIQSTDTIAIDFEGEGFSLI